MQNNLDKTGLRGILKRVSRSFFLTLWIVPSKIRNQLGLAYLFCRAADTIADTELIPPPDRLRYLDLFRQQFKTEVISWPSVRQIQNDLLPHQGNPGERVLLTLLEECFRLFGKFSREDQCRIRNLVGVLTNGMEMDLMHFGPQTGQEIKALPSGRDLDQYCYYVAGVVGEFWTGMLMAHFASLSRWEELRMKKLGVHFGKGLQMTNILKDIPIDLAIGRCYLPKSMLEQFDIKLEDLSRTPPVPRLRALLAHLIRTTLYHLEGGWQYILSIPRKEIRLRLACLWPHLFAVRTLTLIYDSADRSNHKTVLKISRWQVYKIMVVSGLLVFSNQLLTRYYHSLKSDLTARVIDE